VINNTTIPNVLYPVANGGTSSNPFVDQFEPRDPTPNDVNHPIQKKWLNTTTGAFWELQNFVSSNGLVTANWILIGSAITVTETLTGNTGGPVPPTGNNINIVGTGALSVDGVPATSTLTISATGLTETLTGNTGGAVSPTGSNINIVGTGIVSVTGNPGTSTLTISSTGGSSGIQIIDGNTGSVTGSTVTIETPASTGTLNFSGSGTTMTLNLMDGSGDLAIGNSASATGGNSVSLGTSATDGGGPGNVTIGSNTTNSFFTGLDPNVVIGSGANVSGPPGSGCNSSVTIGANAFGGPGDNVVIGHNASTSGASIVIIGPNAIDHGSGESVIIGSDAIGPAGGFTVAVGYQSGSANTSGGSNININNHGVSGESNVTRIGTQGTGSGQQNACYMAGIFNNNSSGFTSPLPVFVDSATGQLGYGTSTVPSSTCAFSAYLTTTIPNATGDGTNALIIYDTERFDIGSNYNTATGLFTAPVTGHYIFGGDAHLENLSAGVTATLGHLAVNATLTYRFFEIDKGSSGTLTGASFSLIIFLNAGDTFSVYVSATGGTKTAGITGTSGSLCANFFSGALLF
jgi:hypothetical protein